MRRKSVWVAVGLTGLYWLITWGTYLWDWWERLPLIPAGVEY
ncbi:MAG TPA: hypothetical protein P5223_14900 [Phycisphaerae bacterium]|jgi:hypothetical protein|nr:hypothetical protein [Phycisphaerae bacterium]